MDNKILIKCLLTAKAALENERKYVQNYCSEDDANLNHDAIYHVDYCLTQLMPVCPNCGSKEKVIISPKPEYGALFCPCNEAGPQYFNLDGSGTLISSDSKGNITETKIP